MATNKAHTSSIAMALAGMTAKVEIPNPNPNADAVRAAAAAAAAASAAKSAPNLRGMDLPTPPNSISPSLPPQQVFKERDDSAPPTPPGQGVDSDIDLQDAVEHAAAQDRPQHRDPKTIAGSLEAAGTIITPNILATHHLPDILLSHGPLAIRHIMGYLTNSVPGFARIPSAKARRLVVGALEGRSGDAGAGGGGVHGDVIFEKVGWGRWDAQQRGQHNARARRQASPVAVRHHHRGGGPLRSPSPYATRTLNIPHRPAPGARKPSSHSLAFSHQSHDRTPFAMATEADKMSMDGSDEDDSMSSPGGEEDTSDVTDEEDWAGVGAAALRSGSFSQAQLHVRRGKRLEPEITMRRGSEMFQRRTPSSSLATSAPGFREKVGGWRQTSAIAGAEPSPIDEKLMEGVNADESEAVKALLAMGSV